MAPKGLRLGGPRNAAQQASPAVGSAASKRDIQRFYVNLCDHFGAGRIDHAECVRFIKSLKDDEYESLCKKTKDKGVQGKADSVWNQARKGGFMLLNDNGGSSSKGQVSSGKSNDSKPSNTRIVGKTKTSISQPLNARVRTAAVVINADTQLELKLLSDSSVVRDGNINGYTFMSFVEFIDFISLPCKTIHAFGVFVSDRDGVVDDSLISFAPSKHTLPIISHAGRVEQHKYVLMQLGDQHAAIKPLDGGFSLTVDPLRDLCFVARQGQVSDDAFTKAIANPRRYFDSHIVQNVPNKIIVDGHIKCKVLTSDGREGQAPKDEPFEVRGYFRARAEHLDRAFALSGIESVMIYNSNRNDENTKIVPLDDSLDIQAAVELGKNKLSQMYLGVVPYRKGYAIRVRTKDYVHAKNIIMPGSIRADAFMSSDVDVKFKFLLHGLPRHVSLKQLVEGLASWNGGWKVVPLGMPRYTNDDSMTLVVGATKSPPGTKVSVNGRLVVITDHLDKRQLSTQQKIESTRAKLHEAVKVCEKKLAYAEALKDIRDLHITTRMDVDASGDACQVNEDEIVPCPSGTASATPAPASPPAPVPAPLAPPRVDVPVPAQPAQADNSVVAEMRGQITDMKSQMESFRKLLASQEEVFSNKFVEIQTSLRTEFASQIQECLKVVAEQNRSLTEKFTCVATDNKREIMDAIASLQQQQQQQPQQPPTAAAAAAPVCPQQLQQQQQPKRSAAETPVEDEQTKVKAKVAH